HVQRTQYFSCSSENWNIRDFLEECDLELFEQKIDCYIKSLKAFVNDKRVNRKDKAQKLLDNFRKKATSYLLNTGSAEMQTTFLVAGDLLDEYLQLPYTPLRQLFPSSDAFVPWQQSSNKRLNVQEFSDLEDLNFTYFTSDHGVNSRNMQNVSNEDAYIKSIQLFQENATEEIYFSNPLTDSERCFLREIWNSLEPSNETQKIRQNKWDKVLQPLLKKYNNHFE
ncbi:4838_t:CDS:2, partial [Funneliformis caledonium]